MIAAIALGQGVLPPPATFDVSVMLVALVAHFALSVAFALILAVIIACLAWIRGWEWRRWRGADVAVYIVNYYGMSHV
jgi:hypothetical protein